MDKNVNNVQKNVNEAMDSRIVRMNEIKSIKLSSVSPKKRVAIKAAKTLIDYIMANWDDMFSLAVPAIDPEIRETQPELLEIINSRREELDRKKNEELERKRKEEEELKELAQKLKEEPKKEDKPQSQNKSIETKKQESSATTVGRGHKVERNIGDIHPNGKWVWVEYKPGKFDWRTIGSRAHQEAIKNTLSPAESCPTSLQR